MKIHIIGSGITGLTLGNFLNSKGINFDIYEKNNEFSKISSGIQLGSNAIEILKKLKSFDKIDKLSIKNLRIWHLDEALENEGISASKRDELKAKSRMEVSFEYLLSVILRKFRDRITDEIIIKAGISSDSQKSATVPEYINMT